MSVYLNRDAEFGAGFQYFVDVDLIARAALKLATGHVAQDCSVRIPDCFKYPVRLLLLRHLETAVHARNDEVEAIKDPLE